MTHFSRNDRFAHKLCRISDNVPPCKTVGLYSKYDRVYMPSTCVLLCIVFGLTGANAISYAIFWTHYFDYLKRQNHDFV